MDAYASSSSGILLTWIPVRVTVHLNQDCADAVLSIHSMGEDYSDLKINTATDKKILATLYSESSITSNNFNNKFLVLWIGVIPKERKNWILIEECFAFEGLDSL